MKEDLALASMVVYKLSIKWRRTCEKWEKGIGEEMLFPFSLLFGGKHTLLAYICPQNKDFSMKSFPDRTLLPSLQVLKHEWWWVKCPPVYPLQASLNPSSLIVTQKWLMPISITCWLKLCNENFEIYRNESNTGTMKAIKFFSTIAQECGSEREINYSDAFSKIRFGQLFVQFSYLIVVILRIGSSWGSRLDKLKYNCFRMYWKRQPWALDVHNEIEGMNGIER